ncbi:hypothetical protein MAR_017346 [Mya arenaria]|uniref:TIR domain-containing protein n=1 Tax=Mya arenaria TaxID=6604 RepID=A0ABY7EFC2_MYAAR|nr:uncharacterized protein LOC128237163 [Mya arenaria]WAR07388.1 hypothetical protein MAR_017346 [Mya arenaria]
MLLSSLFFSGIMATKTCVSKSHECHVSMPDSVLRCNNVIPRDPAGVTTVEICFELQADNDRFAVFLGHNSEDYNFVHENVDTPQNLHFQTIVETDRRLVCTGDTNFRLGMDIHGKAVRLIQQSYVVVLIVTDSFCTSRFCQTELKFALNENKLVVVMLNGRVN